MPWVKCRRFPLKICWSSATSGICPTAFQFRIPLNWTAERASDAAEAMGITAERVSQLGLADRVVAEPLGGAHRNISQMCDTLKTQLKDALGKVQALSTEDMLEQRYQRYMSYGIPV